MACFLVPVIEAVITTAAGKIIRNAEKRSGNAGTDGRLPFSRKLFELGFPG